MEMQLNITVFSVFHVRGMIERDFIHNKVMKKLWKKD